MARAYRATRWHDASAAHRGVKCTDGWRKVKSPPGRRAAPRRETPSTPRPLAPRPAPPTPSRRGIEPPPTDPTNVTFSPRPTHTEPGSAKIPSELQRQRGRPAISFRGPSPLLSSTLLSSLFARSSLPRHPNPVQKSPPARARCMPTKRSAATLPASRSLRSNLREYSGASRVYRVCVYRRADTQTEEDSRPDDVPPRLSSRTSNGRAMQSRTPRHNSFAKHALFFN